MFDDDLGNRPRKFEESEIKGFLLRVGGVRRTKDPLGGTNCRTKMAAGPSRSSRMTEHVS